MKSKFKSITQVSLALSLIGVTAWGAYLLVVAIAAGLASMKSDLSVAIVAASATMAVSIASLLISKRLEARAAVLRELRAKKIPIYESIIGTLFKIQYAEKMGETPPDQHELLRFFARVTEQLVIWGSDDVVREFRVFRMHFVAGGDPIEALFRYENLLNTMRKDLGHQNQGFKRGTLLGLWVNDIDRYTA